MTKRFCDICEGLVEPAESKQVKLQTARGQLILSASLQVKRFEEHPSGWVPADICKSCMAQLADKLQQ